MDWLSSIIRNTWLSPSEVPQEIQELEDHRGGQGLLRELGIRKAVLELRFTDRTMFTGRLNKRLFQQGPRGWHGVLAILLSPLVGQDLYELGKALWDLSDVAQHVKRV